MTVTWRPQLLDQEPWESEKAIDHQTIALLAATLNTECINVDELGQAATEAFQQHRDYAIITSFPSLGDLSISLVP
jgi:hypothetical protein